MFIPRALDTIVTNREIPKKVIQARRDNIIRDLPDLLDSLVHYLESGVSLPEAMSASRVNLRQPLSDEIDMILLLTDAGVSLEEAMKVVANKVDIAEFDIFVTACTTAENGRIRQINALRRVGEALRGRNEALALAIATEREARLSAALIAGIFFMSFAALCFLNQQYVSILFTERGSVVLNSSLSLMMICLTLLCFVGRVEPGMDYNQIRRHAATLGNKIAFPLLITALPALMLVAIGPAILQ